MIDRGVLIRSNLCEIYKNAVRCSARHRLFCIFHPNSTLLDLALCIFVFNDVCFRSCPNLVKIYKIATWCAMRSVADFIYFG